MTTPHRTARHRIPARLAARGLRVAIRLARNATDTLEHCSRTIAPTPAANRPLRADAGLTLTIVDDPDGRMRLVGVRGPVDAVNVATLLAALEEFANGLGLHLDLTDATIAGVVALRRIEGTVDQLERQGVHVRIVGVDPEHPALLPPIRP